MIGERVHLPTVTSTNDVAKKLISYYEKLIITADQQTAGRGQRNRQWYSPPGNNLYCSIAFRHTPPIEAEKTMRYFYASCIALKQTVEKLSSPLKCLLKYPNDLYIHDNSRWKKVAGVLQENIIHSQGCVATIIGIGVNIKQTIFPEELHDKATSLALLGISIDRDDFLTAFVTKFLELLSNYSLLSLFNIWKAEIGIEREIVRLDDGTEWEVQAIDPTGALTLSRSDQTQYYHYASASLSYDLDRVYKKLQEHTQLHYNFPRFQENRERGQTDRS